MSGPHWSAFHQQVEDALARLIAHYDATLKVNGSNVLLCEYLAPRVARAIVSGRVPAVDDLSGAPPTTHPKE